jgi:hypothetical protein
VAYPLNKTPQTTNAAINPLSNANMMLPPSIPMLNPISSPPSNQNESSTSSDVNSFDSNVEKQKVLSIFNDKFNQLPESVQSSLKTKLQSLENDFDSLDLDFKKLLSELAGHISTNDSKSAGAIQRTLILKGCKNEFLHVIRKIILEMEPVNDQE